MVRDIALKRMWGPSPFFYLCVLLDRHEVSRSPFYALTMTHGDVSGPKQMLEASCFPRGHVPPSDTEAVSHHVPILELN